MKVAFALTMTNLKTCRICPARGKVCTVTTSDITGSTSMKNIFKKCIGM